MKGVVLGGRDGDVLCAGRQHRWDMNIWPEVPQGLMRLDRNGAVYSV